MSSKVIIGLPAFNEENGLTPLLEKINVQIPFVQEELSVLIVNDGSTDHTEEVIQKNKMKFPYVAYINHHKNMGLGEAMQTLISLVCLTSKLITKFPDPVGRLIHCPCRLYGYVDKLNNSVFSVLLMLE